MKKTEFTTIFKSLRTDANVTLRALSDGTNLSAPYLRDLEYGNRNPSERVAEALIEFYSLDVVQQRALYDSIAHSTDSLPYDVIRFLKDNPDELDKVIESMYAADNISKNVFVKK